MTSRAPMLFLLAIFGAYGLIDQIRYTAWPSYDTDIAAYSNFFMVHFAFLAAVFMTTYHRKRLICGIIAALLIADFAYILTLGFAIPAPMLYYEAYTHIEDMATALILCVVIGQDGFTAIYHSLADFSPFRGSFRNHKRVSR